MALHKFSFRVMGGPGELQLHVKNDVDAARLYELVLSELQRIERKYSRYVDESVTTQINERAGNGWTKIDEETAALLTFADTAYTTSHRLFDLTSGVLRRVWNFKEHKVPERSELAKVLPLVGWDKVELRKGEVRLLKRGMEIDFGGIGKEYAIDRAIGLLITEQCQHALLNLAGDLRVIGPNADDIPWRVGIQHPRIKTGTFATVDLKEGALATSGDYERFFEVEGRRFCHILNPKTGYPVSDLQSVSVFSASCLAAGCLATSAMLLGSAAGIRLLREAEVRFLVVKSDGSEAN